MRGDAAVPSLAEATPQDRQALIVRVNQLYHDLQAGQFDSLHARRHQVERRFWQHEVAPRLVRAGARQGVDLCSGTGFVPRVLLARLPAEAQVLCLDLSPEALDQTVRALPQFAGRLTTHVGDAAAIPLPDGRADWVSLNAGLHHIDPPEPVLREVDRVLRPGGRFCLGYEPNAAFFASAGPYRLERLIWHAFWYLSPRRNWRRLRRRLARPAGGTDAGEHLEAINQALMRDGLIARPLALAELRDLVDVHTHDDQGHQRRVGFVPDELRRRHFPDYHVELTLFTDFGGEMLRPHRLLRAAFDALMRTLFPGRGRLFSWILRKPAGGPSGGGR